MSTAVVEREKPRSLLDELAQQRDRVSAELEAFLTEFAIENPREGLDARTLRLCRMGGMSDTEASDELRRVRTVIAGKRQSGTRKEREEALRQCESATAKLHDREPAIQTAITKLQAELATLKGNVASTRAVIDRQEKGVKALRDIAVLPREARNEIQAQRTFVHEKFRELQAARNRAKTLEWVCSVNLIPGGTSLELREKVRTFLRAELKADGKTSGAERFNAMTDSRPHEVMIKPFEALQKELRGELVELKKLIAAQEPKERLEKESIARLLDFYLDV